MDACNVKVIIYPNGTAQVRKYHTPVRTRQYPSLEEKFTFQEEKELAEHGFLDKDGKQYALSPFGKVICERLYNLDEIPERKKPSECDLIHSVNRAKRNIYGYARCASWEYFVTVTFSPEKTDRYDYTECSRMFRRWLNNQRRNAPDLLYIAVPEQHKDGAWHFHCLLANVGNMKFSDSGKKDKSGKTIYNMHMWSYGFSTATAIEDVYKVANYIGKYITKDLCKATPNKQRYFVSKNLPKPEKFALLIDGVRDLTPEETAVSEKLADEEKREFLNSIYSKEETERFTSFLGTLVDSLGYEVTHVSRPRHENSFVDVDYYELQGVKPNDS